MNEVIEETGLNGMSFEIPRRGCWATMTSSQKRRMPAASRPANKVLDSVNEALVTLNAYRPIRASIAGMGVVWPRPIWPSTSLTAQPSHRLGVSNASSSSSCSSAPMSATSSHIIVSSLIASSPDSRRPGCLPGPARIRRPGGPRITRAGPPGRRGGRP